MINACGEVLVYTYICFICSLQDEDISLFFRFIMIKDSIRNKCKQKIIPKPPYTVQYNNIWTIFHGIPFNIPCKMVAAYQIQAKVVSNVHILKKNREVTIRNWENHMHSKWNKTGYVVSLCISCYECITRHANPNPVEMSQSVKIQID